MLFKLLLLFTICFQDWTYSGELKRFKAGVIDPSLILNYEEKKLQLWAIENLQNGDIICRHGREIQYGINFSDFVKDSTASKYSHSGLVDSWTDEIYIYDMFVEGTRRIPFHKFYKECYKGEICILRLRPEIKNRYNIIANALEYSRDKYIKNKQFDYDFSLSNERFYCNELVVKSFIQSRMLLCRPVAIENFKNINTYKNTFFLLKYGGGYLYNSKISMKSRVYIIGNKSCGLIGSRYLYVVYEGVL